MEKSHISALLHRNIGTQKGKLLLLLVTAAFLTSFLVGGTGSAATWRSFQSPVSPVTSPPGPAAGPAAPPATAASSLVLWIVIGLVVVGTFVVGVVFFQKRRG
jgi:hypothetical protein